MKFNLRWLLSVIRVSLPDRGTLSMFQVEPEMEPKVKELEMFYKLWPNRKFTDIRNFDVF